MTKIMQRVWPLASITIWCLCTFGVMMSTMANDTQNISRKDRIIKAFNDLRADNLDILDAFYHPQLKFHDPVGDINGLKDMKAYYAKMYETVTDIRFDFDTLTEEGNNIIATWTMYLKAKGLNSGKEVKVIGVSHIRFDEETNLVIYHRDYFDMGEFIYEYIPVLGGLVRMVKGRLKHD